jgi:hypothetical protein
LEKERTAEPPSELKGHSDSPVERQMSPVVAVKETSAAVAGGAKEVPTVAVTSAVKEEERPQQSYLGGFVKCAHNKMRTNQIPSYF